MPHEDKQTFKIENEKDCSFFKKLVSWDEESDKRLEINHKDFLKKEEKKKQEIYDKIFEKYSFMFPALERKSIDTCSMFNLIFKLENPEYTSEIDESVLKLEVNSFPDSIFSPKKQREYYIRNKWDLIKCLKKLYPEKFNEAKKRLS